MASSTPHKAKQRASDPTGKPSRAARQEPPPTQEPPPMVDPRWILKALAAVVLASVFCAYLTLCWLYYHGQWQIVLQPNPKVSSTPAALGIAFQDVAFDDTETGQPQLAGWWIPAASTSRRAALTILYCHDGRGNLSDALADLKLLHGLGANVFAFDYRGFGRSAYLDPSQRRMYSDAETAWNYLTATRGISPGKIVLAGDGVGAAVAANTSLSHSDASALVMISPYASLLSRVLANPRSGEVPARLLFHNSFDAATMVPGIRQPKLIVFAGGDCSAGLCPTAEEAEQIFKLAAYPKEIFNGSGASISHAAEAEFISRFLDQYLPASAPVPL